MALVLDHIGLLTPKIEALAEVMTIMSEFSLAGPITEDPHHHARIQFLSNPKVAYPRLELIEPMGKNSPLRHELLRGGGSHHVCFQVGSLDGVQTWCKMTGARLIYGPNPAPAFGEGRDVVFVHAPGLGLVEFVSTAGAQDFASINKLSITSLVKAFLVKRQVAL